MNTKQLFPLIMSVALLTACGGGGGGGGGGGEEPASETAQNSPAETVAAPATAPPSPPVVQQGEVTTAELLVERDYTLKQESTLALEVSPSDQAASYLSVCSEFDPNQTGYAINYGNCLIRTAIEGPANFSVQVPNAVNSLIAVRWYYEAGSEPVYSFWTRERDGDIFSIR